MHPCRLLVTLAALAISTANASAQGDKPPVRILVGLAAGGTNDLIARELAEQLRGVTGESYIVENKPGATQRIALGEVKRAAPDGRTLILATNTPFSILPTVYGDKTGYDPVKDFTPIARIVKFEVGVATGPKVNAKSFADYVAWCKANPSQATFGSPGAGTSSHFMGILIGKAIGVPLAHVPYRGGTPAQTDLMGGHLPMLINGMSDMRTNHEAGKLNIIAIGSETRSPLLPSVPTLKESGIDVAADIGIDIYGPAGMAPELVKQINASIVKAITSPAAREKLSKYGVNIAPSTPAELAAIQAQELKMWEEPVRISGFKGD